MPIAGCKPAEVAHTNGSHRDLSVFFLDGEDTALWMVTTPPAIFTADDLYNDINGGATQYIEKQLLRYFIQDMESGDRALTIMAMEYPEVGRAKSVYEEKKAQVYKRRVIPGYDENVAIGNDALGAVSCFHYINNYYFELVISGYGNDLDLAARDISTFLNLFDAKYRS